MARCTADLEFLQCDLCRTYFHKDIFCPHRRECKGPGSVELKKAEAEQLLRELNRNEDAQQQQQQQAVLVSRAQLDSVRANDASKARTALANQVEDENERDLRRTVNKKAIDDALAFLNS